MEWIATDLELIHSKLIEGTKLTVTDKHIDKVYTALEVQEDFEEFLDLEEIFCEVMMGHKDSEDIGGTADVVAWSQPNNIFCVGEYLVNLTISGDSGIDHLDPSLKYAKRLLPSKYKCDGFFIVKMRKKQ